MPPRISVVIPYREEPAEFLRECLESLIAQSFSAWEAIIVDDGSVTHRACDVVADYRDARLRLLEHDDHRGLAAARNTGIHAAATPWIALLDADDRLHPDFLQATACALQGHPNADWVVVDWQVFGFRNEVWPLPIDDAVNCPAHFLFAGAGLLMRKTVWEQIGGYVEDPRLRGGEDWDFWITAAERGLRPLHLPRPLYQYRLHSQAMSRTSSPYNEHVSRRMIYQRHRSAFQAMGLACPKCPSPRRRIAAFLSQGYLVSAHASWKRGRRLRALRLAGAAFFLYPTNPAVLTLLTRIVTPQALRRRLRALRS